LAKYAPPNRATASIGEKFGGTKPVIEVIQQAGQPRPMKISAAKHRAGRRLSLR
jgi:hypothetical protein